MSTHYAPIKSVSFAKVFDGRLEQFGIWEHVGENTNSETRRCLTDGRAYLWVYANSDGNIDTILSTAGNVSGKIFHAIEASFDTYIASEYDPEFWGFETEDEMDFAFAKIAAERDKNFLIELRKYLTGEPNDISVGTVDMEKAKIAEKLISKEPALLLPDKEVYLWKAIEEIYISAQEFDFMSSVSYEKESKTGVVDEDDIPF
jgi:hypothetical protein